MKKLSLTFLLALISLAGFSQFSKGTWLVGGSISADFQSDKNKNGNTTTVLDHYNQFTFNPQAGYFVIDNLAVGAGVLMSSSTTKSASSNDKTTTHDVSLSPFLRYYYKYFYGQASVHVGSGSNKVVNDAGSNETTYNTSGWSVAAGYALMLNESVAVEPQIGYQSNGAKYSSTDKDVTSGLFINIGFQIYLKGLFK